MARPKSRRPVVDALVARGLAGDAEEARRLLDEGVVVRNGGPVTPATLVAPADVLALSRPPRFASRGGDKLDHALERLGVDVAGRRALDVGSSTGGFVDCLLQRGAVHVTAVDVGPSCLLPRLADDPRVEVRDRTDARRLDPGDVGTFGVATADASMVSLTQLLAAVRRCLDDGADLVTLVKPQYEADLDTVRRAGGIVRDPGLWRAALLDVATAASACGLAVRGLVASPIRGRKGNVEFLLHAVAGAGGEGDGEPDLDALVASALAQVPTSPSPST